MGRSGTFPVLRYHSPMRRIFSTLLVLMLVLRGLLGDAMAMGVMPVMNHHQSQAVLSGHTEHAMHDGLATIQHHDMAGAVAGHCTDNSRMQSCGSSKHHGASCSACDICNSSLHAAAELVLITAQVPQSLRIECSTRFVSAQPALMAKPPIL